MITQRIYLKEKEDKSLMPLGVIALFLALACLVLAITLVWPRGIGSSKPAYCPNCSTNIGTVTPYNKTLYDTVIDGIRERL